MGRDGIDKGNHYQQKLSKESEGSIMQIYFTPQGNIKMRRAFLLVEVLTIVVILAGLSLVLAKLFLTFSSDIPRSFRVIQENTTLLAMLSQMQKDIDSAKEVDCHPVPSRLPLSAEQHLSADKLLLIKLADGMICYQLEDGKVLRHELIDLKQLKENRVEDTRIWQLPHTKIQWQVRKKSSKGFPQVTLPEGYAVEIKTHMEHKVRGRLEKRLANSYLYFVGAFPQVEK